MAMLGARMRPKWQGGNNEHRRASHGPNQLAWLILDVVDQLDLATFYRAHRDDGHGHPAYDPKLLLACCCTATASEYAPPGKSNGA